MGNEREDLAQPTADATSPDNGTRITRSVTNACVVIPVEVPGVIGVTADGNARQTDSQGNPIGGGPKAVYSHVGGGGAQLLAPRRAPPLGGAAGGGHPPPPPARGPAHPPPPPAPPAP